MDGKIFKIRNLPTVVFLQRVLPLTGILELYIIGCNNRITRNLDRSVKA